MKSIIIIHLCVLLLTFVSNGVGQITFTEILDKINNMTENGGNINGVFQPSENGYLGQASYSISFKGTMLTRDNMEVTMKFTPLRKNSDDELKCYMKLIELCDKSLEVFGVPTLYHYSMWDDCAMVMAMTLFDPEYHKSLRDKKLTETDLLILFREFVRISQYTHHSGVFFQNIDFNQMTFFREQCFIYEFSDAGILAVDTDENKQWATRKGWQKFIRALFRYLRDSSSWSFLGFSDKDSQRKSDARYFLHGCKVDMESKKPHKFTGLRRVLVEFARQALADDSTPITKSFYNKPNRVILEEIERCKQKQRKRVEPSWLSNDQDNVQPSASGGSEAQNRGEASSSSSRRRGR